MSAILKKILSLIAVLNLFFVFSKNIKAEINTRNSISVYNGFLTPKDVSELISTPPSFKNEYFAAAGYMRHLFFINKDISVEGEGLGAFHYGSQHFKEYVAAVYIRYKNIFDNTTIVTGAIGDGISYSEKILNHEHRRNRKSTHYINYLGIELTFGRVDFPVSMLFRLHHRSSAYGLIMNGNTDSNFLCIGIRYEF